MLSQSLLLNVAGVQNTNTNRHVGWGCGSVKNYCHLWALLWPVDKHRHQRTCTKKPQLSNPMSKHQARVLPRSTILASVNSDSLRAPLAQNASNSARAWVRGWRATPAF